jgi:hypothetical protein
MSKFILQKTEQIRKIHNILKNAKLSEDNYQSTSEPFFIGSNPQDFKIGHNTIPELPDSLNRHFKTFYEVVGNPKREVYINEWTIMSLDESLKRYNELCSKGQKNVFDIGYRYLGMGHIEMLSCNLYNHLLFMRRDGGSNGYDREYNYKKLLNFNYKEYEYFYFNHWYNDLHIK